jgi:hypothetical protein
MNIFNLLPFTAPSLDLIFGQKMTIATFYRVMFFTDIAFWATQCTDELRLPAISAIAPRQSVRSRFSPRPAPDMNRPGFAGGPNS